MRETDIDPSSSPLAAYGAQLRRLRKAKALTQPELGRLIGFSATYVSYLERGERPATLHISVSADSALESGGTLELMWWGLRHTALLEGFPEFAAQEAKAVKIRTFEMGVIPGLLQTPDYATALAAAAVRRGAITQQQADERVAFLTTRQALLERSPAPLFHAVLDESCLRRPVGGREAMTRQLQHLERMATRPKVIVQLAPFHLGERAPFTLPVWLLTMPDRTVLGYSESQQRGYLERESDTVAAWERDYDWLQVEALSQADSLAMIKDARKDLCSS
ncbi:helix-turn-helix transcriptional regulator [Streptacidiphilus sp. P02-A3a]|uniref:helix-turn-helix domain-containing protein n=1 Tax=Streptacidiphilus sp. P02-A3a TaxID=2704468 RepID=UPI0015F8C416|nr:helix-turn-helix transcriptional regulator [Streptacidiphilus sp. P02-A3a]QMU67408.1 helix-turn-helix domain-containing protein [Streptacidiphilus sp. P02-A3a]